MGKKQEDNRDIFEKALDIAPMAGAVGGALVGRKIGRRMAKSAHGDRLHGVNVGETIYDPKTGGWKKATEADVRQLERTYKDELGRGGTAGFLSGGMIGGTSSAVAKEVSNRNRRK